MRNKPTLPVPGHRGYDRTSSGRVWAMTFGSWFDQGVVAFREGRFEDALPMFDKAIELGSTLPVLYDSRSAVLEKLGRYGDALKDAKKAIDISPRSPQGYTRSAKLFAKINRHDAALKMIDMAISRMTDPLRVAEASLFRADTLASQAAERAKRMCHIGKLPVEILWEIMAHAVHGSPSFVFTLHNVCQHWRKAVCDLPALWRTLILGQYRPMKKLAIAIERTSKHPIPGVTDLTITNNVPPSNILQALGDWCSSPVAKSNATPLSISIHPPFSFKDFTHWIDDIGVPPSLRSLAIQTGVWGEAPSAVEKAFSALWKALHQPASVKEPGSQPQLVECPLESLALSRVSLLAVHQVYFPRLLTLRLLNVCGQLDSEFLSDILNSCPRLEHFELEYSELSFRQHLDVPARTLPSLRTLRLRGPFAVNPFDIIIAPRLEILTLKWVPRGVCRSLRSAWSSDGRSPSPPLVELRLDMCGFKPDVLAQALECVPTLRTLEISGSGENINLLVHALAGLGPLALRASLASGDGAGTGDNDAGAVGERRVLLCPRLEHVDFSWCTELKGVPIRDLVKSRLPPADTEIEVGAGALSSLGTLTVGDGSGGSGAVSGNGDNKPEMISAGRPSLSSPTPAPIRTVIIDRCPKVESELLPWLRTKVVLSCVFEGKTGSKRRRGL